MNRFLIRNEGPIEDNIAKGLAVAVEACRDLAVAEMAMIVPHKGEFPTTAVGKFIGEAQAKRMAKGECLPVHGVGVRCESIDTASRARGARVVLVFYLDAKGMKKVDGLPGVETIVFVPWLRDEGDNWQRMWNAKVLGENIPATARDLDPEVVRRLDRLTTSINLSTGLHHPSDEGRAKQTFAELREQRKAIKPAEIEIWAVRNRWSPTHAAELRQLAQKYVW